jgi:SagB-type dehydrogenase family enzyme
MMAMPLFVHAQATKTIQLTPPDIQRGLPYMEALSHRASQKVFDTASLKLADLSDLLWAANGINRPDVGKRTAPSALNAQDIDIYVFFKTGIYLYNAKAHVLDFVEKGDHRILFSGRHKEAPLPPVICLLVSDISRFKFGETVLRKEWAAMDAGIVSQNISIFCASVGLATRPRASMDKEKLRKILKLSDTQYLMMNQPVSYKVE